MPSGLTPDAKVLWIRRHGWEFSYEAFQPPLYYVLALPAWFAGHAIGGALGSLYAVRIFDALVAALLAPLAMMILLALWPGHQSAAWAAGALTAVVPGVALNLSSVTNDVLVSVLGALCILVAVTGSWSWRRAAFLGALFGAALLSKTSAIGIAPALVVALLQTRRDGGVRPLLIAGAVAAACVAPWLASNVAIYGELITTREQLALAAAMALVAAGLWVELPSPRLRWGTIGTFAGLSLGGLALTVYSGALPPPPSGVPVIVRQVSLSQSGTFHDLDVSLVACGVDGAGERLVQVRFYNTGTQPVEWTQTADLL